MASFTTHCWIAGQPLQVVRSEGLRGSNAYQDMLTAPLHAMCYPPLGHFMTKTEWNIFWLVFPIRQCAYSVIKRYANR